MLEPIGAICHLLMVGRSAIVENSLANLATEFSLLVAGTFSGKRAGAPFHGFLTTFCWSVGWNKWNVQQPTATAQNTLVGVVGQRILRKRRSSCS